VEFAYDYTVRAPAPTITVSWDEAIIAAVSKRKAQVVGAGAPVVGSTPLAPPKPGVKAGKWGLFGGSR
jgi:hypothetical protein